MTFSIPAISLNNNTFKKKKDDSKKESQIQNYDPLNPDIETKDDRVPQEDTSSKTLDSEGYAKWNVPWNFNLNYNISLGRGEFNYDKQEFGFKWVQSLSFGGNIQFSKNWNFTFNSSYNFDAKEFGYTSCSISRDLHCWSMSASFIPIGPYKSYNFTIRADSSLLQDLKWDERNSPYDRGASWY
jgi:hypothetical protein